MPADPQDSAPPAVPGQDRPPGPHPAPADPALAGLTASDRLSRAAPECPGAECAAPECAAPECAAPGWAAPECTDRQWDGAECANPRWDGAQWDGSERADRRWDGPGWADSEWADPECADRRWDSPECADPELADPELADPEWAGAEPEDRRAAPGESAEPAGPAENEPGPVRAVRTAFALGQPADGMSPGAVLAGLSEQAWQHGLAGLDEDQLTGMLQAADRLAAWSAALRLAAVSQLAGRRQDAAQVSGDGRGLEHLRDEIAMTLTLTGWSADRLLGLAVALDRLPLTQAALATGAIDERRAEVIADELAGLGAEHIAAVEERLVPGAAAQTTAQLRQAARRAVIAADPGAAKRRKEKAVKDARVETFTEAAGTAALAGRDLPPAAVLAADTNLTSLALNMRSAGAEGTLDQLRARAYMHLLSGQPAASLCPPAPCPPAPRPPARCPPTPPHAPPPQPGPGLPAMRGVIHLTLPLATWLGWSQAPGEAAGYGALDADDSRAVAAMLGAHPATTWCVTLTGRAGRPVAHGCAGTRPSPAAPRASPVSAADGPGVPDWLGQVKIEPLQAARCTHPREGRGYQPGPALRHLIQVRNPTCTAPGCRRPAQRCDLDHTVPHHLGGRTCECNLGPLCRRHHRCKQVPGWTLTQTSPGTFTWTTPAGRRLQATPAEYPG